MKKTKNIIKTFLLLIIFSIFSLSGYFLTNTYKQYLDFTYKKAVTQAYKYISDLESTFFYYT